MLKLGLTSNDTLRSDKEMFFFSFFHFRLFHSFFFSFLEKKMYVNAIRQKNEKEKQSNKIIRKEE